MMTLMVALYQKHVHVAISYCLFTAREFDAAKHFDTHPAFVDRKCNRPKRSMLEGAAVDLEQNEETMRVSTSSLPLPSGLSP